MRVFPEVLSRNWQLKLSALAMAVLLWTVPAFEGQNSRDLQDIPVRVDLNDPEWALLGDPLPATVEVTVSGPTRALMGLSSDRPSIVVPVDQVSSADTAILLLPAWLRTSVGEAVTVDGLAPSSVRLSFEPIDVKAVDLVFRSIGALPANLSLVRSPEISPAFVRVFGPASRLERLSSVNLRALDLSQIRSSGTVVLPLDTTGLSGMTLSLEQASLELLLEETVTRSFSDLPVLLPALDSDPQLQARPAGVTVTVTGARSLVEALAPGDLRVTVSGTVATALVPGEEVRATLSVEGAPGVTRVTPDPEWVLLRRPTGL